MVLGAPSVMTSGTTEMPVWCADSWDTPHMVGIQPCICSNNFLLATGQMQNIPWSQAEKLICAKNLTVYVPHSYCIKLQLQKCME